MENKRGSGIFLGVVGVATLVVAIIGATFAYFTATVSGSTTVDAQSYEFSMTLTVSKIAPASAANAKDLIPLATTDISSALTGYGSKGACVDKEDYSACIIYDLSFANGGSQSVTLNGSLDPGTHSFSNLYYRVASTEAGLSSASDVHIESTELTTGLTSITVPTTGAHLYLMLYVQDTGGDQPNDKGKNFSGTLTFADASGDSNARLQATFS